MDKNNHTCVICGKTYYACNSCDKFKSWQSITDTSNHFQLYMLINDYCYGVISKQEAIALLSKCDITGWESFNKNIVKVIKELITTDQDNESSNNTVIKIKQQQNKPRKNKNKNK